MTAASDRTTSRLPRRLGASVTTFTFMVLLLAAVPWVAGGQGDAPGDGARTVPEPPELIDASIVKNVSPSPDPVLPATTLTYELVYTMSKDYLDATDVYITDTLSTDVVFGGVVQQPPGLMGPTFNSQEVGWHAPSMTAGATGTIVFTVTVNRDVLSGTIILNRAEITSTTQEDANADNNQDTVSTQVFRPRFRVYLPLIVKRYRSVAIANPGFEKGDASGWAVSGDFRLPAPGVVSTDPKEGSYHLLLGDPSYCNAPNPGQRGDHVSMASQDIFVPEDLVAPTLTFWYRVFTHDHLTWRDGSTLGDSFDVRLDGALALRDNFENYDEPSPGCGVPTKDSGWRLPDNPWFAGVTPHSLGQSNLAVLDLTGSKGEWVELRFELWTRFDGYYNTWAYVDDVRIVEGN